MIANDVVAALGDHPMFEKAEAVMPGFLNLTLKADWLLAINSDGLNRPMGPRIYFGFIFAH